MNIIKTDIDGVVIIEPKIFGDARGYFFESFSQKEFEEKVESLNEGKMALAIKVLELK